MQSQSVPLCKFLRFFGEESNLTAPTKLCAADPVESPPPPARALQAPAWWSAPRFSPGSFALLRWRPRRGRYRASRAFAQPCCQYSTSSSATSVAPRLPSEQTSPGGVLRASIQALRAFAQPCCQYSTSPSATSVAPRLPSEQTSPGEALRASVQAPLESNPQRPTSIVPLFGPKGLNSECDWRTIAHMRCARACTSSGDSDTVFRVAPDTDDLESKKKTKWVGSIIIHSALSEVDKN